MALSGLLTIKPQITSVASAFHVELNTLARISLEDREMKFALRVTLALGGLSLLFAALGAFAFYIDWISQPTLQVIGRTPNIAASVTSAQDIASLKVVCRSLAEAQDTNTAFLNAQSVWLNQSMTRMASFSLGWGLICGIAFIYIHFLLRKLSPEGSGHAL